ncbi:RING finger protein 122 isoform X1 [Oryctolagus cuniculus]|uniref:RING finger protein 122 isoform X1 n=1 Tax=Oryctolagus cuniculus TaxID=9986 RepID=UPI002230CC6A|nr:RING finger protein 122 isoform X1 [Oryctolagus cuniculus]
MEERDRRFAGEPWHSCMCLYAFVCMCLHGLACSIRVSSRTPSPQSRTCWLRGRRYSFWVTGAAGPAPRHWVASAWGKPATSSPGPASPRPHAGLARTRTSDRAGSRPGERGSAPAAPRDSAAAGARRTSGCFCGLGLVSTNKSCSMPPISFQDLPLNIYMVIFGTGIFVFMLSLIFCCYFISKLRNQAQSERYGYKEVVLKGDAKKLQLYGQTCAVCLEDFKGKDELGVLPCQHAFHRKCLVKWLEVRCVCPMCNKPIAGPSEASQSIGILLDELV